MTCKIYGVLVDSVLTRVDEEELDCFQLYIRRMQRVSKDTQFGTQYK